MAESAEEYRRRLDGYTEGKDPLRIQAETPAKIARMVDGFTEEQIGRRSAPDRWSTLEILAHLAEDELASGWRYRQMIEHDGVTLQGFDQDLWARLGKYAAWNAGEALALFRLLRAGNLRMLQGLSPEQWERSGNHVERGRLTVRELARHMAAHDINHMDQIGKLLGVESRPDDEKAMDLQQIARLLQSTMIILRERVTALPERALSLHPGSAKWCIKEVIGHLTEEDTRDFSGRIKVMLDDVEPDLTVNDQDEVARARHDCEKSLSELLTEFETVRKGSIDFVMRLRATELGRGGVHPKIGRIRVGDLLHEWIYHDLNHMRQIDAIAQHFLWDSVGALQAFYLP